MRYPVEKVLEQLICEAFEIGENAIFCIQNKKEGLIEVNIPNPFKHETSNILPAAKNLTKNNCINIIQVLRIFYSGKEFNLTENEPQIQDYSENEMIFYIAEARRNGLTYKIEASIKDVVYKDNFLIHIRTIDPHKK